MLRVNSCKTHERYIWRYKNFLTIIHRWCVIEFSDKFYEIKSRITEKLKQVYETIKKHMGLIVAVGRELLH